ncbi:MULTISPECIES: hypothetical protein [Anoxynatronum]|uniref:Uncharacterized protein n=2 Tax=Anoxynatronum TaxID=210622 RepID=A0AA46AIJ0_9CLOT|nr:hypothetical protein [Anoxynatronum buryatiense]SMP51105.1 hypothetical protein SAMN06296020_10461 [Anoxynatronum buryatiense]
MKKNILSLTILLLLAALLFHGCTGSTAENDHGHEHGDLPYEWSGELNLEIGTYEITFEESEDESMDLAFVLMDGSITDLEHHGQHVLEAEKEVIAADGTFTALPDYGYTLKLNPAGTHFYFTIEEAGRYMLFAEHLPEEFNLQFLGQTGEVLTPENQITH